MFKNFSKVFKFTFKNQVKTGGYKGLTIILTLIFLVMPVVILYLVDKASDEDDKLKSCGADIIYVVDTASPDADFNTLSMLGIDGYTDIRYINSSSVEDALETIKTNGDKTSLVLEVGDDEGFFSRIILPEGSLISEESAENYDEFIAQTGNVFAIIASGASMNDLAKLSMSSNSNIYDIDGYKAGTDLYADDSAATEQQNQEILETFSTILTFLSLMIIYFIAIFYGNGIMQNIVLEKSSKLMDTMLISLKPQALIFGKMLGVIAAALLQFFCWIIGLVGGLFAGVKIINAIHPENKIGFITFLESFKELNIFRPANVIIAVLVLIFGIIFYCAISAICGAISSTKEEAASNQTLFVIILLISFYLVIFGLGGAQFDTYIYILPSTAAMVLPAAICTGTISLGLGLISFAVMVLTTVLLLVFAGKLYKMMALYKGNNVNIGKAVKMLVSRN